MHAADKDQLRQAYERAQTGVLVAEQRTRDRIDITGRDRMDLLDRISTNSFKDKRHGDHQRTALLEANGRLIDLLDVFVFEDRLILSASAGSSETVKGWLDRHIFFQDDASVELEKAWDKTIVVLGPHASKFLSGQIEDFTRIEKGSFLYKQDVFVLPLTWAKTSGYRLHLDRERAARIISSAQQPISQADAFAALEAHRIQAGIPRMGNEIVPGIIPLEAGLRDVISFSKGCYIGQEIIARLDSRGELASKLVGLRLAEPAEPGAEVKQAGKQVGELTSCAHSPAHGWIGLAYVKTRRLDPNKDGLSIDGTPCRIVQLPFPRA
jgi:aminomethyltransferase